MPFPERTDAARNLHIVTDTSGDSGAFKGSYRVSTGESSGGVLVEFAILVWTFLLLLFSVYDLGQYLHAYYLLSQACYEGARAASMTPGLANQAEVNRVPTAQERMTCHGQLSDMSKDPEIPCALLLSNWRISQIMHWYEYSLKTGPVTHNSKYDGHGAVTVTVSAPFGALFPLFRYFTVRADVRLPYLVLSSSAAPPPKNKESS